MVVGGARIHARVSEPTDRQLPAVVLVHGLSVSSRYLVPLGERLAADHRVFAPDLPGFGLSDKPPAALDVPALAVVLEQWLDARGVGVAVLVGHSLGCQIAIWTAARSPRRVSALALFAPTIDSGSRSVAGQGVRLLLDAVREPIPLVLIQARDYLRAGLPRTLRTLRFAVVDEPERRLPLVRVPSLVARGSRDPLVSASWAGEVARLLPDARTVTIERVAHAVPFSAPETCADLIRELALRVPRGPDAGDH